MEVPDEIEPTILFKAGLKQKQYPQFLYKYRADNTYTRKIITENELWFSPPSEFNDPYDCNTPFETVTTLEEFNYYFNRVGLANVMTLEEAYSLADNLKDRLKQEVINGINQFWICCFSTLDNSILQWSHYSDYHKGVCFCFDLAQDPEFFISPVIVSYRSVMQHYNHFTQSKNIVEYLIKPKFRDWSYESEVRIIKDPNKRKKNNNSRAFKFSGAALSEIIFGTNTPQINIELYKRLCLENDKTHVKFFKMKLSSDTHYELLKEPV